MTRIAARRIAGLALAAALLGACAGTQPPAPEAAPAGANIIDVPAGEPIGVADANRDVFEPQPDGSVRHRQSGAACPARVAGLPLSSLVVYPMAKTRGNDVSCGYGNFPQAVITLYLVQPGDYDPPLDFATYAASSRHDVTTVHPTAVAADPPAAPEITLADGTVARPSIDAWDLLIRGERFRSLLYLHDAKPWTVMLRVTGQGSRSAALADAGNELWRSATRTISR